MVIPDEFGIFFISSREKEFSPGLDLHGFGNKLVSILGIYFSHADLFKLVSIRLMIKWRIGNNLDIILLGFFNSLNEFSFFAILGCDRSLLIKFSEVEKIIYIVSYGSGSASSFVWRRQPRPGNAQAREKRSLPRKMVP